LASATDGTFDFLEASLAPISCNPKPRVAPTVESPKMAGAVSQLRVDAASNLDPSPIKIEIGSAAAIEGATMNVVDRRMIRIISDP
jgi:hypothetical protein